MSDRDRLTDLLADKDNLWFKSYGEEADYLLKNGVIAPPCRAGDRVWIVGHRFPAVIDEITINIQDGITFNWSEHDEGPELTELWDDGWFTPEDIGKTVFLTREEAEAALAKEE